MRRSAKAGVRRIHHGAEELRLPASVQLLLEIVGVGEMGDVLHSQAKLFAGLKTCVVGDADNAGLNGALKWVSVLRRSAACKRVTRVELPYSVSERHGRDARDFLIGVKE